MSLDARIDEGSLAEVAALLGVPDTAALAEVRVESLRRRTHRQLLEISRRLGLVGVSRLTKDALAAKLGKALLELAKAGAPAEVPNMTAKIAPKPELPKLGTKVGMPEPVADGVTAEPLVPEADHTVLTHKFEIGEHGTSREEPRTIPWSYGLDRVTAMPVDPERLFVYWEITDDAMTRARAQLGAGGGDAWINLRVYDVSGRLFDGTNAHSYFDHRVERHDRQWFFVINKPSSEAVVDLGLRSSEGYFVKVARSGRIEFPRRGPVGWSDPEWMSVRAGGAVSPAGRGAPGHGGGAGAGAGGGGAGGGEHHGFDPVPLWRQMRAPWEEVLRAEHGSHEERIEWEEVWSNNTGEVHRTFAWESPLMVSSWETGPFTYPVEVPQPTTESFEGALKVFRVGGRTQVVYGPWEVVIRGLGAQFSRQVLARWEVQRSWLAEEGHEVRGVRVIAHEGAGSSELLAMGASERRWRGESELRLRGASERFFLAASERRLGGASETQFLAASQWLVRGASERRLVGGSEIRLRGASERMLAGASEWRYLGGSEGRLGGASELRLGGASELRLGGSEARLDPGEPIGYPSPPSSLAAAGTQRGGA